MATLPLTPSQLQMQVAQIRPRERDPEAQVIGIHTTGSWQGPETLVLDDCCYTVVQANTVLEVREALQTVEERQGLTILLTRLEQADLGYDVVARLARSRLFPLDVWEGVRALFKARLIDPTLRARCVAQALLEYAPPTGYLPVQTGVLDAGTAWRALFHHGFGMADREPDLASLLLWAASSSSVERYRSAVAELREAARERLTATIGPAAGVLLTLVDGGAARDALALAVVCGVVFAEETSDASTVAALHAAAVRLERFHSDQPIAPELGRQLAKAAQEALEELAHIQESPQGQEHVWRADELLHAVQAGPYAYRSPLTPRGLEQRLQHYATQLREALDDLTQEALAACERLAREVAAHLLASRNAAQLERTRMAGRLLRWLREPLLTGGGIRHLARRYRDDLAFVDWAREALVGGEDVASLSEVYRLLEHTVSTRRAAMNQAFAAALCDWTQSGAVATDILLIEDVLVHVVRPVVQSGNRVLLVVLDGMSWPVCHELLADIRQHHWATMTPLVSGEPLLPVIATIPCITELSRSSLLAGALCRGDAHDEKRRFAACASLGTVCERSHPPVVYHKGDLTQGSRGALRAEVRRTIASQKHKVVGVVINAVDDRLRTAQQLRDTWTVEAIRPLGALLQAARETGRIVILTSDHGHVWHRDGPGTTFPDAGERWRPASDTPGPGEVLVQGSRVRGLREQTQVIVPWQEHIRYGVAKNGYHGGVTPQEMVVPLVLLADAMSRVPGLQRCELAKPAWWLETPSALPAPVGPATPKPQYRPGELPFPIRPDDIQVPAPRTSRGPGARHQARQPGWTKHLLVSPVYLTQKQLMRRHAPDDGLVLRCLLALEQQGGVTTPVALAQDLDIPVVHIDNLLARLQRLLNIDGYTVLQIDHERNLVTLHMPLLQRQFALD